MEQLVDTLLPDTLLNLVIKQFKRDQEKEKQHQAKLLRVVADRHRLQRLRAALRGTFRERFLDVALSDPQFAQMACMIAEFQQYLLHDDILALALYNEEAAMEIFAEDELCEQLTSLELSTILFHHPHTTRVLLELANQQHIIIDAENLASFVQIHDNLLGSVNISRDEAVTP